MSLATAHRQMLTAKLQKQHPNIEFLFVQTKRCDAHNHSRYQKVKTERLTFMEKKHQKHKLNLKLFSRRPNGILTKLSKLIFLNNLEITECDFAFLRIACYFDFCRYYGNRAHNFISLQTNFFSNFNFPRKNCNFPDFRQKHALLFGTKILSP